LKKFIAAIHAPRKFSINFEVNIVDEQKVYFMPESIEYAHRKCEKVNTHKQ